MVEKAGKYYVRINISKQGRDGTDLMTSPFDSEITNAAGIHYINNGGIVNREITIATNYDTDYAWETSGAYMFNAQWKECGLTSVSNVTYKFNSATTYKWPGSNNSYYIYIDSASKEIQLRKEHGTSIVSGINSSKIYGSRSTVSDYAVDTINIDYR